MPPNSCTSSLDAQNGSANNNSDVDFQSQESFSGTTYPTVYTIQSRHPAAIPYSHSAASTQAAAQDEWRITNGHGHNNDHPVDYSDTHSSTNGEASQSTPSYDTYPAPKEHWDRNAYQQDGQYYLATPRYPPQDVPSYDRELVIDSIEDEPAMSPTPTTRAVTSITEANHPAIFDASTAVWARQPSAEMYPFQNQSSTPQTQPQTQTSNIPGTPTARRWSREYSPEERMRVGLPRFPTEEHRREYERQQRHQRHSRQQGQGQSQNQSQPRRRRS